MPIEKSAFKDLRRNKKRALRNKKAISGLDYLIRKSRQIVAKKDFGAAKDWVAKAVKALDKTAQRGIIKKNKAARLKSRLMVKLNSIKKT